MTRTLPLKALHTFATVAQQRSFSRAADVLCVSQSAVSHQIRSLESYLDSQLIDRGQQPIQLTESGQALYSVLADSFYRIDAVCQHLRKPNTSRIAVVAQTSLAVEWLAPRLNDFRQAHPDIDVLLHMESSAESLQVEQFDVILGTWPCPAGFASQSIGQEWWFPVCSPEQYRLIDPKNPNSLFDYPLYSSEQGADWQLWQQHMQLAAPAKHQIHHVSLALLATKAVTNSKGFALSNRFITNDAINNGLLIPLTHWRYPLPWGQYQVHYRHHSQQRNPVASFVNWIMANLPSST